MESVVLWYSTLNGPRHLPLNPALTMSSKEAWDPLYSSQGAASCLVLYWSLQQVCVSSLKQNKTEKHVC